MDNMLVVNNLTKKYKDFTLDNISFSLPKGCVMGLIGENGAGKSTTIKSILRLVMSDSGEVNVLGSEDINLVKENIGVVMDDSCFPENLNAMEINSILKRVYKTWNSKDYFLYLKKLNLPEKKNIKDYSRGMRMKLSIIVALSHQSKLLILDEATSGLDPVVREEILDIFLEYIQDGEKSILLSSHIISDIEKISDYITFIHNGKIILSEEKDKLLNDFGILKCSKREYNSIDKKYIYGAKVNQFGVEALVNRKQFTNGHIVDNASIEDIMLFMIKEA